MEWMAFLLFFAVFAALLSGYPVAFVLGGVSLIFAFIGHLSGTFDDAFMSALTNRLYGIMITETLIAVPLFVFMGVMLERAKIAENLLDTMALLFGPLRGGIGISVMLVGMLLAASTGIVGATVVTMGLLSLPAMLKRGYDPCIAAGTICASGTLGQIIPPSIVLVLLGDVLSSAYQQAQLNLGIYSPKTVSVGDLFVGAIIPGFILVGLYLVYLIIIAILKPQSMPAIPVGERKISGMALVTRVIRMLLPPLFLIFAVLGSIITGFATPTEAASVGALGALLMAIYQKHFTITILQDVMRSSTRISCMVFMILIGAALFSLVFRGFGGDESVHYFLADLPGGKAVAILLVMAVLFLLGFILDFIEITFIVVPIVGPVLLAMGIDPIWLGIMIAINLQTSFLTPPFGFALFYLRGVAPHSISTGQIYRGAIPFIGIQLLMLLLLALWPQLATWLPSVLYSQ